MQALSIGEVAQRTGVGEGTLRMWEQRYGFPEPTRTPAGARRYGEHDVQLIRQVAQDRDRGLGLRAAIARAQQPAGRDVSVFARLRGSRPELLPQRLDKRSLIAITHAIEDESFASAEQPVVLATFQRERFYRQSQRRWEELARTARLAVALAAFPEARAEPGLPVEVPLAPDAPLHREWSLVVDSPGCSVCLSAWEVPEQPSEEADGARTFEVLWTIDPELVRDAARVLVRAAVAYGPAALADAERLLDDVPPAGAETADRLMSLTNRMIGYLARANGTRRDPAPS